MRKLSIVFLLCASCFAQCGKEREAVKTLADRDANLVHASAVQQYVSQLVIMAAPTRKQLDAAQNSRFTAEKVSVTVHGILVGFKLEADHDLHIVIRDLKSNTTMIVEMASPVCVPIELAAQMLKLRTDFQSKFGKATSSFKPIPNSVKVAVTGPLFFDIKHGVPQTGVAHNGIEIHPVTSIIYE